MINKQANGFLDHCGKKKKKPVGELMNQINCSERLGLGSVLFLIQLELKTVKQDSVFSSSISKRSEPSGTEY